MNLHLTLTLSELDREYFSAYSILHAALFSAATRRLAGSLVIRN